MAYNNQAYKSGLQKVDRLAINRAGYSRYIGWLTAGKQGGLQKVTGWLTIDNGTTYNR